MDEASPEGKSRGEETIYLLLIKYRLFGVVGLVGKIGGALYHHFLPPIPRIMRMYRKILIMYM
jgi:hypothetical protein